MQKTIPNNDNSVAENGEAKTLVSPSSVKLTPLMEQYWAVKNAHPDKILLFRMGDFFEIFHEDAVIAAQIIGITLTSRNKKSAEETKMCGVPYHSIATPIAKLLDAGYKVAICDQLESPSEAKGLVKRGLTRILSPGMVYDPDQLDQLSANYIASFDGEYLAFVEASTAEAFYYQIDGVQKLLDLLSILSPREIVVRHKEDLPESFFASDLSYIHLSEFDESNKFDNILNDFQALNSASRRLMAYMFYMQGEANIHSSAYVFEERKQNQFMKLSASTIKHLELFVDSNGDKLKSLFHNINKCQSAAGARLLKSWLSFPLFDLAEIKKRQQSIVYWQSRYHNANGMDLRSLRKLLAELGDVERRLLKLSHPNSNPRDLISLADALETGLQICTSTADAMPFVSWNQNCILSAQNVLLKIRKSIEEDAPVNFKNSYYVKKNLRADLDELIVLTTDVQAKLNELEEREKTETGISSLKVRYNSVFGYYIEVTNVHKDKVPKKYIRKQTLVNAERYITEELQELELKVLSAKQKRMDMEYEVFVDLCKEVKKATADILNLAKQWSELDVLSSLAWLAIEKQYQAPEFFLSSTDQASSHLVLKSARHPVVENMMKTRFVANDIDLQSSSCLLLTGPNMAGKSTLMRQVAVLCIMAQVGSFVPAAYAKLPLLDRIFTRIGASDSLAEGLSTFMVEMKETAQIIQNLTSNTLVLIDEIGRGTSTYDGMSLAQAILEDLLQRKGIFCLFATHYHELSLLVERFENLKNAHMAITDRKSQLEFLYLLKEGPANKSYGIHVARLAGLNSSITQRAQEILSSLESEAMQNENSSADLSANIMNKNLNLDSQNLNESANMNRKDSMGENLDSSRLHKLSEKPVSDQNSGTDQLSLFDMNSDQQNKELLDRNRKLEANYIELQKQMQESKALLEQIKSFALNEVTPIQAMNKISSWQEQIQ